MEAVNFISGIIVPAVIAALGAVSVYLLGEKAGLMDVPGERSSHSRSTPRGGGVGVWIASVLITLIAGKAPALALLIFLIGALGLFEDIFGITPKKRLLLQFIVAFGAVLAFSGTKDLTASILGLGFFWLIFIVWTTNLYNFMDGIDGIAGLTGIVGFSFLAHYAFFIADDSGVAAICVSISAASLGFLFFNFPKAKVFMGDVGSVSLGFIFAVIMMKMSKTFLDFLCLGSFMFTFYADEMVTMTLRIKRGEDLFKAHRRHFYQILANEMKMPHWKISLMYAAGQIIVAACVLYMRRFGSISVLCVLGLFFGVGIVLNYALRKNITRRA